MIAAAPVTYTLINVIVQKNPILNQFYSSAFYYLYF